MPRFILFLTILILGPLAGWLSARVMLDRTASASGIAVGGWHEITHAPGTLSATYEDGYFLARGQLPPPQHVRQFVRERDDAGNSLRTDCATRLEGLPPPARWWQISATTRDGTRAISTGDIVREADGSYVVTLWNAAAPGNWLQLGEPEDFSLRLFVHASTVEDGQALTMPSVRRLWC
jgi:hypothetical protein